MSQMSNFLKQSYDQEDDSPEWERIKNFVGGRNKPSKHPLVQEAERNKQRQPEHFDEGGIAGDSTQFPGVPPYVPEGMPTQTAQPTAPAMPSLPTTPTDTSDADATKAMGNITPDTIQRLAQTLTQQSKLGQVGAGIAGIGDAIQSVGGIKGEHMKDAEDYLQKNKELGLKLPGEMAQIGKEHYALQHEMEEEDPNSKLSKYAQDTYGNGPLAKILGPGIKTASAKMIAQAAGIGVDQLKNEAQEAEAKAEHERTAAIQSGELDLRKQALGNTAQNQKSERVMAAIKELNGMPYADRYLHPDRVKELEAIVKGGGDTNGPEGFNHAAIPSGTVYTAPDGTRRKKQ